MGDAYRPNAEAWFDRMLKALEPFDVALTLCFTPAHLGIEEQHTSPPRDPDQFAQFAEWATTYNLGGGIQRSISVIEMLREIELRTRNRLNLEYQSVRPSDQPWYSADTGKLERDTGWKPRRTLGDTVDSIHFFWKEKRGKLLVASPAALPEGEVA